MCCASTFRPSILSNVSNLNFGKHYNNNNNNRYENISKPIVVKFKNPQNQPYHREANIVMSLQIFFSKYPETNVFHHYTFHVHSHICPNPNFIYDFTNHTLTCDKSLTFLRAINKNNTYLLFVFPPGNHP